MSFIQGIVLIVLAGWAVYHTVSEIQQDKRIDKIEEQLGMLEVKEK